MFPRNVSHLVRLSAASYGQLFPCGTFRGFYHTVVRRGAAPESLQAATRYSLRIVRISALLTLEVSPVISVGSVRCGVPVPGSCFQNARFVVHPLILLVSRAEAERCHVYRNRRKRCSRVRRPPCRPRNNTLFSSFFFSCALFIHSNFGILMDTFCKLQFF